jgi:hypothetical protein
LTREHIGNFPQAFTCRAMIDEADTLDEALNRIGPPAPAQRTTAESASARGVVSAPAGIRARTSR